MSRKDISDYQVLKAHKVAGWMHFQKWPYELLEQWTGEPCKVCYRAMERAFNRDLIEYGTSLRTGWLTEKGEQLFAEYKCAPFVTIFW